MGTADASVLWKANSAVREKVAGFNLLDGRFDQLAEFPTLIFIDGCLQILNFRNALANEHHQGDIRDSGQPELVNPAPYLCGSRFCSPEISRPAWISVLQHYLQLASPTFNPSKTVTRFRNLVR